jgi:hypothetical protein
MKHFASIQRHLHSRAFWAGFFSAFSLDITGRTQGRMVRDAIAYEYRTRSTREILERTDAEALAEDREALRSDWDAVAKDFPDLRHLPDLR